MSGGAWLTTAQYHPFIRCQASQWSGGSDPNNFSTSSPASSARRLLYHFNIAAIEQPNLRMRDWSLTGYWNVETILSTSLHVVSNIHAFSRASQALGFGTSLRRSAKRLSSLVRVVGGQRKGRLRLPRYSECSLKGALRRHPRTK